MPRMIAVKTYAGYRAARVEYDKDELLGTLQRHWSTTMSMHGLVAQGDMLTLTEKGGMRVSNRGITRIAGDLTELLAISAREGIHCLTVFDETATTYDQFAEWNMTCEAGEDLFLENISEAGPWHHLIDGQKVAEAFRKAA
ncbi:hypothetical protein [uncultured Salinicola sp.]|uniref:hypothetical protein n=1 Tax=uncultured Salinicola sp. TaxID=1193542 RepID=UPI002607E058|nr:hypothetical protein [uncultured Salinicola sp.]|tara:strand:- start:7074 stop:7496 length:423 start_codon:yes stop_codon:yes gene_type:complete